jgi:hypothetical protein
MLMFPEMAGVVGGVPALVTVTDAFEVPQPLSYVTVYVPGLLTVILLPEPPLLQEVWQVEQPVAVSVVV